MPRLNLVILCNRDLASCVALNYLLPALCADHQLQLILSARVGKQERPAALQALQFAEQVYFNECIFPLAGNLPAEFRGPMLGFDGLAALTGKELKEFNKLNEESELAQFQAMAPDLVISIRYGVILRQAVLDVPRLGVINLHSGRLPDYRGVMASFWALRNGEDKLGTCLHYIDDASIDTGRVIATTNLSVDRQHSYLWHVLALYRDGSQCILEAVAKLAAGEPLQATAQAEGGAYYSLPDQAALEEFSRQGWQLFTAEDMQEYSNYFIKTELIKT